MNENKLQKQIALVDEAFHRIWYRVLRQGAAQLDARLKISQIEMHIIGMVYEKPNLLLKDIRKRLDLPQTTLSSMIAKLENRKLIKRVINRSDLRSFSLQITEKGRKLIEAHKQKDYEYARNLLMVFDEKEREQFSRLFYKAAMKVGESKL